MPMPDPANQPQTSPAHRIERFTAMGSPCTIALHGAEPEQAEVVLRLQRERLAQLEARYTRYRSDSLTSRINQAAGERQGIPVDDETAALLDYAQTAWEQSEGLFDLTSGVLRKAWDLRANTLPTQAAVDAVRALVGWDKVEWEWPHFRLPQAGMELDFGGLVKEYAADQLAHLAQQHGIHSGWVDLGGDVAVIGPQPGGTGWKIGLRDPRDAGRPLQVVRLSHGAVASSGDYERCMVVDGQRYGHVLNPLTGWPVQGVQAVSVLSPHCLIAGTACTVAMLKGDQAQSWLQDLGLPWVLLDDTGHCASAIETER